MSKIDDGGPAFPVRLGCDYNGMSLRKWYAGQALKGLLSSGIDSTHASNGVTKKALEYADGMIAEGKREITALPEGDKVAKVYPPGEFVRVLDALMEDRACWCSTIILVGARPCGYCRAETFLKEARKG